MKRVFIVIALVADGAQPGDERRVRDGYVDALGFGSANRRRKVRGHFGAKRVLLKVGAFPTRA
jgi:hypothetical protein